MDFHPKELMETLGKSEAMPDTLQDIFKLDVCFDTFGNMLANVLQLDERGQFRLCLNSQVTVDSQVIHFTVLPCVCFIMAACI